MYCLTAGESPATARAAGRLADHAAVAGAAGASAVTVHLYTCTVPAGAGVGGGAGAVSTGRLALWLASPVTHLVSIATLRPEPVRSTIRLTNQILSNSTCPL